MIVLIKDVKLNIMVDIGFVCRNNQQNEMSLLVGLELLLLWRKSHWAQRNTVPLSICLRKTSPDISSKNDLFYLQDEMQIQFRGMERALIRRAKENRNI